MRSKSSLSQVYSYYGFRNYIFSSLDTLISLLHVSVLWKSF